MQMVSAVKMRKAQQAELEGRPYREGLRYIISKISPRISPKYSLLLNKHNEGKRKLIIFVSANKGLAGSFSVNLFRFLMKNNIDFHTTDFITVGNKGAQFVSRMGSQLLADFSHSTPIVQVSAIFSFILDKYVKDEEYSSVSIVYNKFISTLRSQPVMEQLLPFTLEQAQTEITNNNHNEYLIEPSPEEIIDQLLRSYIEDRIRGAIISSEAVEHSMRMMAMKNATDNAEDVIYNLTLVGNKLRQEKITNELLDMVTAKESVES